MAQLIFRGGALAGKTVQLPGGRTVTLGRSREVELPLPDLKLSRRHCQLEPTSDGYLIRDLGSTNGTFVNGERIAGQAIMKHLDLLQVGDTEIEFHYGELPSAVRVDASSLGMATPAKAGTQKSAPRIPAPGLPAVPAHQGGGPPALRVVSRLPEPEPGDTLLSLTWRDDPLLAGQSVQTTSGGDAVLSALRDVDRPLPPEPMPLPGYAQPGIRQVIFCDHCDGSIAAAEVGAGLPQESPGRNICLDCLAKEGLQPPSVTPLPKHGKLIFCDGCNLSIPQLDLDLGIAKELNGHWFCKDCLAKAVKPESPPPPARAARPVQDLDAVLAGLDHVEVIPDEPRRRPSPAAGVPAHPPPVSLEPVGEVVVDDRPAARSSQRNVPSTETGPAFPPRKRTSPLGKPPSVEGGEDDLVEIKGSGPP